MRILYLSASYIPSRRASSVHVMKMCAAMAGLGHQVTLVAKKPRPRKGGTLGDHAFYGVEPTFDLVKLSRPEIKGGGVLFALEQAGTLRRMGRKADLLYCRDIVGAQLAAWCSLPVCFEVHGPAPPGVAGRLYRSVLRSSSLRRLVVISDALRTHLEAQRLLPRELDVVLARDAADPPTLGPPDHGTTTPFRVGYVGNLYKGRGIELILRLADRIPTCEFEVIGGSEADLPQVQAVGVPPNVTFHGFVAPGQIGIHYERVDILLMPYQTEVLAFTGRSDISRWFSPMKMFEYMATGRPIVSSNLPAIQEVLRHEENALLVEPSDLDGWERAVSRLINNPDLRRRRASAALGEVVDRYTWPRRAQRVLAGLDP